MGFFDKLTKIAKAAMDEANKPESFSKGDDFENYVRDIVFPKDSYELVHRTANYQTNKEDFVESTMYPDFLFRCKKTNKEFYVEVKYRSYMHGDKVSFSNSNQLQRYKEIDKGKPVFICLGLQGNPKRPEVIFLMPVSKIKYPALYPNVIAQFEFPYVDKPVFSGYLWKLLE